MKNSKVQLLCKVAMLAAVAALIMLFEFTLPFVPPFYKIDFSEVIVLLAGFSLGPLAAVMVEGTKIILNLIMDGTTTMFVGELANFVVGCAFVLPASIIYRKNKSKKSALIGLLAGTLTLTLLSAFVNLFVMLPAYSFFMNLPIDTFVAMGTEVNASITSLPTLILFAVVPFNFIKGVITSIIVLLIYKRVSPILKKEL